MATASVGVAYALKGRYTALELLREADVALNLAKDGGGSRHVVFDAELRARASARVELERELRRAVEDGELVVQYQPIVTAADGTVEQVEALVRWRHPTRGLLPPHHFLSVASESGLILDVGQHVLGCACEQAARWSSELGRPVEVAVNLAERQLFDPALIPTVAGVLRTTGLPAAQLQLEISEELLGAQLERVVEVLGRLARIGVGLALDDFGTSRASLRQLESLGMIRTLKLDRAFVAGVAEDEVDRTLVSAVMALARSLGMVVVAEGVETPEQARALTRLGVHRLQGFYFQRPTEAEAITPLLSVGLPVPAPAGPADA
jgi:EAL domain-containing protein (putative c-di-GMP-specific phosphodiesterase class I)